MKHDTKLACETSIKGVRHLLDQLTFSRLYRALGVDDNEDDDIGQPQSVYPNTLNFFSIHCTLLPIAVEYRLPSAMDHGTAPTPHPIAWLDSKQNLVLKRDRWRHTPLRNVPEHLNPVQQKLFVLQVESLYSGNDIALEALEEQRLSLMTYAAHET